MTSLTYFSGIVEETAAMELNLNYWRYLSARVKEMDAQWRCSSKLCASRKDENGRNEIMLLVSPPPS